MASEFSNRCDALMSKIIALEFSLSLASFMPALRWKWGLRAGQSTPSNPTRPVLKLWCKTLLSSYAFMNSMHWLLWLAIDSKGISEIGLCKMWRDLKLVSNRHFEMFADEDIHSLFALHDLKSGPQTGSWTLRNVSNHWDTVTYAFHQASCNKLLTDRFEAFREPNNSSKFYVLPINYGRIDDFDFGGLIGATNFLLFLHKLCSLIWSDLT